MQDPSPAFTVLAWNIFHGRDRPPDRALYTWRSRLFRVTERNATHVQVNRSLLDEFAGLLADAEWAVCLLQEVPPLWADPLAARCGAEAHQVLTSRNQLALLRRRLGRWNPDLLGSWEGGSNLTLVRSPWRIAARASALLNPFPRRGLRERRRIALTALVRGADELCVANLHASAGSLPQAEQDVRFGAVRALAFANRRPLVLGGDFNLQPRASRVFEELERDLGLVAATADDAIDHLLVRNLEVVEPPHRWQPEARELGPAAHPWGPGRLRLSDHAPVEARFRLRGSAPIAPAPDVR
jgi:endonuclease/exonuclease/phosphatase family metal-dependent hydrolase